jgi:hypothetical protein
LHACCCASSRYGIDDLRLYKALDLAGLEGRVVVVDTMQFADAVLTTRNKRTGKAVNLADARRAAQAAGVPLFVLRAVSAQRVLEALAPLLGFEQDEDELRQQQNQAGQQELGAALQADVSSSSRLGTEPRLLRWEEVEGDGSEELLQLLWGPAAAPCRNNLGASQGTAVIVEPSPRWLAWCAAQQQRSQCADSSSSGLAWTAATAMKQLQAGAAAAVLDCVRSSDVEDTREELLPANPTQRAGERYKLQRPVRHGSRLRRRRLQRDLWLQQVPW